MVTSMNKEQIYEFLRDFSQAAIFPVLAYKEGQCVFNSEAGTNVSLALS